MKTSKLHFTAAAIGLLAAGSLSAGDVRSPSMLANTCAGCHGTNGASQGPASPTIAGLSEEYFVEVMTEFASGDVPSTIMGRIAKGYSDEEFQLMASVFAKQPVAVTSQQTDAAKAEAGSKLYEKNCEKCHDEKGALADDDAGILYSQWLPYLQYSMEDFMAGSREMPKKMKKKVEKLSDAEIDALLHFFASQQ